MVIEGMYLRTCSLSFVAVGIFMASPFRYIHVLACHLGGVCVRSTSLASSLAVR